MISTNPVLTCVKSPKCLAPFPNTWATAADRESWWILDSEHQAGKPSDLEEPWGRNNTGFRTGHQAVSSQSWSRSIGAIAWLPGHLSCLPEMG